MSDWEHDDPGLDISRLGQARTQTIGEWKAEREEQRIYGCLMLPFIGLAVFLTCVVMPLGLWYERVYLVAP